MPVCLGKCTRLIQFLPSDKQYIAEVTLGITTDSYDSQGQILSKQTVSIDENELKKTLKKFTGEIVQQVPLTSAVHYKGKKLYEYAHKGVKIEDLPTRKVAIYSIKLLNISYKNKNNPVIQLQIDCSSGTYIRSIASDLGKELGCGAYLSNLTRTISASLHIKNSITLENVATSKKNNDINRIILDPRTIIKWDSLTLSEKEVKQVSNGQYIVYKSILLKDKENIFLQGKDKQIVGVGKYLQKKQIIKPYIVFN